MSGKNVTVYHKDGLVENGRAIELHTGEILKISSSAHLSFFVEGIRDEDIYR